MIGKVEEFRVFAGNLNESLEREIDLSGQL